jgi:hypothetical protein
MKVMKTVAWRRVFPRAGDVWVQVSPITGKYRWRCPSRSEFAAWSFSHFATHEDAFAAAERTIKTAPFLDRVMP